MHLVLLCPALLLALAARVAKAGGCQIPRILHGSLKDKVLGRESFNFYTFRYERKVEYNTVSVGNTVPSTKVLYLFCEDGHTLQGTDHKIAEIQCFRGSWNKDPVCLSHPDIQCPVFPDNDDLIITYEKDRRESSKAFFSCRNKNLELVGEPVSTCLRTKWSAPLPLCADPDIQCPIFPDDDDLIITYEKDRRENSKAFFSCRNKNLELFGEPVSRCLKNKEWSTKLPFCAGGCQIPRILHGSLKNKVFGPESFNFYTFRYERKVEYYTVSVGNTVPHNKVLYLFCDDRHTFQGTAHQIAEIQCFRGSWNKYPVCLRQGDIYVSTTTVKPLLSSPTTISLYPITTSHGRYASSETASTKMFPLSTIPSRILTSLETEEATTKSVVTDHKTENLDDQCSCYYPLDDRRAVAHANGKRLSLGDKVLNGTTIIFHCLHVGYHHLMGRTEITCADCQPWGSSDFPSCTEPPKVPSCTAENLLSLLPHNAQLEIEIGKDDSFPVNSTVKLTCKNEMVVIGNPLATCGKGGKWIYDKIKCDSGCEPPARHPDSKLKLSPEKNVYKFGDRVTLSCPPGMKLDSESQVIMCFMNAWSEKIVPDCVQDDYEISMENIDQTSFF